MKRMLRCQRESAYNFRKQTSDLQLKLVLMIECYNSYNRS